MVHLTQCLIKEIKVMFQHVLEIAKVQILAQQRLDFRQYFRQLVIIGEIVLEVFLTAQF